MSDLTFDESMLLTEITEDIESEIWSLEYINQEKDRLSILTCLMENRETLVKDLINDLNRSFIKCDTQISRYVLGFLEEYNTNGENNLDDKQDSLLESFVLTNLEKEFETIIKKTKGTGIGFSSFRETLIKLSLQTESLDALVLNFSNAKRFIELSKMLKNHSIPTTKINITDNSSNFILHGEFEVENQHLLKPLLDILVNEKFCLPINYRWDPKKGKKEFGAIIMSLRTKGYYKKPLSLNKIIEIAEKDFGLDIDISTLRNKEDSIDKKILDKIPTAAVLSESFPKM